MTPEQRAERIRRTREWAEKFEEEARLLRSQPAPEDVHPLLHKACADAAESQAYELRSQLTILEAGGRT